MATAPTSCLQQRTADGAGNGFEPATASDGGQTATHSATAAEPHEKCFNGHSDIVSVTTPVQKLKQQQPLEQDRAAMEHQPARPKVDKDGQEERQSRVWFALSFRKIGEVCLAMPLVGLVACFLIAVIFQFGDIQETACKVRMTRVSNPSVVNCNGGKA